MASVLSEVSPSTMAEPIPGRYPTEKTPVDRFRLTLRLKIRARLWLGVMLRFACKGLLSIGSFPFRRRIVAYAGSFRRARLFDLGEGEGSS